MHAYICVHTCIYPPGYSYEHKTANTHEQLPLLMNMGGLQAAEIYNLSKH